MFAKLATGLTIALFANAAFAEVTITEPMIKEPAGAVGVAFFTATSNTNDAITGAMSDCCKALEIHRSEKINGVMSMRKISKVALPKGETVEIQPGVSGGEHLMLIGLSKPLKDGDTVNITLNFEKGISKTVAFPVVKPKAASPEAHDEHSGH